MPLYHVPLVFTPLEFENMSHCLLPSDRYCCSSCSDHTLAGEWSIALKMQSFRHPTDSTLPRQVLLLKYQLIMEVQQTILSIRVYSPMVACGLCLTVGDVWSHRNHLKSSSKLVNMLRTRSKLRKAPFRVTEAMIFCAEYNHAWTILV